MSKAGRRWAAFIAAFAWAALVLQYVLLIGSTLDTIGPALASLQFFSFFTILSNLLVALATGFAVVASRSAVAAFFASARVRGGVVLCIGVTGLIYFFVLSSTWAPQGLQWGADKMLHYCTPVLYIGWWLRFVPHRQLVWSDVARWLLFPGFYLVWVLLRGAWLHEYPYPFLDVVALGYPNVLLNSVGVAALFGVLGLLIIALDRRLRSV